MPELKGLTLEEGEMPVFAQKLTMHMNGGSKFSVLQYEVFADGEPTGIQRAKRTNGRPRYLIESDVFRATDGEEFDVIATKGVGLMEWLEAHACRSSKA